MTLLLADAEVCITRTERQLSQRPARAPDYASENAALIRLADEMAERPHNVLQTLCEVILDGLNAGSAGISLLQAEQDGGGFYWPAIAGEWAAFQGGGMPLDASPCGVVIDSDAVLLFQDVAEDFPAAAQGSPPITEIMLAPFHKAGRPIGTVWALAHDPDRRFDREDKRLLTNLARFASAAYQTLRTDRVAQAAKERLHWRLPTLMSWASGNGTSPGTVSLPTRSLPNSMASGRLKPRPEHRSRRSSTESPRGSARVMAEIRQAIDNGTPFGSEYRVISTSGATHHLLARGECGHDADGKPTQFPGIVIDITQQRLAERALLRTEDRYRSLFNTLDAGFCVIEMLFDAQGQPADYRFIEVNPAFQQRTGLASPLGRTMRELAPDLEQHWFDIYGRVALTGEPARFENPARALDDRWYDVYAYRVGQPEDRQVAILFTDISDRRRMEQALRASEHQFRSLAQAMPCHVWTARPDGMLDWFNDQVYQVQWGTSRRPRRRSLDFHRPSR